MNRVLIGISTYNEIENLPDLIVQIEASLPQAAILVVDDNSPDGTGDWCEEQARLRTNFFYIGRSGKLGLGTATMATMQYAIDNGYEHVVNMDADLSHPPSVLPQLVAAMEDDDHRQRDVAVGSRYVPGGAIIGWPLRRRIMSRCVNTFARWALGLPCRDCSGSYRCYRVAKLREIGLQNVRSKGYSFFEEILWHLRRAGANFVEVPITFRDREKGQSKINLGEAFAAMKILSRLAIQSRMGK